MKHAPAKRRIAVKCCDDDMIIIQVTASYALVAVVLFFMWRLPRNDGAYESWAPPLALLSPWLGLTSLVVSALLWVLPQSDRWLVTLLLLLAPAAVGASIGVLWIYRRMEQPDETVFNQRLQAKVGLGLGILAVVLSYVFVMVAKTPFTPVGS